MQIFRGGGQSESLMGQGIAPNLDACQSGILMSSRGAKRRGDLVENDRKTSGLPRSAFARVLTSKSISSQVGYRLSRLAMTSCVRHCEQTKNNSHNALSPSRPIALLARSHVTAFRQKRGFALECLSSLALLPYCPIAFLHNEPIALTSYSLIVLSTH